MAITGGQAGARDAVMRLMAGIEPPPGGTVAVGGTDLATMAPARIAATLAHAPDRPGLVRGTLRETIAYGLFRRMPGPPEDPDEATRKRIREARATGNLAVAPDADWVDYAAAGVAGPEALDARIVALTREYGLSRQLPSIALSRTLPPEQAGRWSGPLMAVRAAVSERRGEIADLIEPWSVTRCNANASVLANLLYALPRTPAERPSDHLAIPELRRLLHRTGGDRLLERLGWSIAETLAGLATAARENSAVLERLSGFSRRDVTDAAGLVADADARGRRGLGRAGRRRLMALAANFVEVRDQLDVLDDAARAEVLAIRGRLLPRLRDSGTVIPLDAETCNPGRTAASNILHAPRRHDRTAAWDRIDAVIGASIAALGLEEELIHLGLAAPVEEAALPSLAVRRIGLVRCLLKRPRFLMLAGTADLHPEGEAALMDALRAALPGAGIAFVPSSPEAAARAAEVMEIGADGRLAPRGS